MTLSQPNLLPTLLPKLRLAGAFDGDPLTLIDVGCAYGIEAHWRAFPLRARAIDPLLSEIERLQGVEEDPGVEYVAGFIRKPGYPSTQERETGTDNTAFVRSSAMRVTSKVPYNDWVEQRLSDRVLTLNELAEGLGTVDFLKTDTDGGDLEVLHSGSNVLDTVLGVSVEAVIGSSMHPLSNSRSNIDQLLRSHGLTLYDEESYRYSRACLPDEFTWGAPGITRRGQVIWSQCLYLRDIFSAGDTYSDAAFRKLAGIFEVYNLNDCAVELIQARPSAFAPFIDPTEALDLLAKGWWPEYESYEAVQVAFEADYTQFYRLPEWRLPKDPPESEEGAPEQASETSSP